jgi:DNA-binding winged helix-turn-helix (wHTH) protein/Flp pilus assembly protein TadD
MSVERTEIYEFGRFRLDVGEHKLVRFDGHGTGSLPEKAFRTLVELVRHRGSLVTHDDLLEAVWPGTVVEKNNVGKAVHAVRSFLGDTNGAPRFIETVPKHGYRFLAEVTAIGAGVPSSLDAVRAAARAVPARSEAYDLFIRGKVKSGSENVDDIDGAIAALESAVALDPLFAEAFAHLARAYNTRAFKFSSPAEAKALQENAEVALEKALDLRPDLAEAHFARGLILWTKTKGFPHEQAILSFKKSLQLDAHADEAHHQLSMVYSHVGLLDAAREHVETAVALNPNNTMARFRLGVYTAWQCRFEDALAVLKTVPSDVSPMLIDRVRAEVLVQLGRLDDAADIVDEYLKLHPSDEGGSFTSMKALLFAKSGERRRAERLIDRAIAIGKGFGHFHHTAYNIASAYAALDEPDQAVRWLEAAADDGFPCFPYFARDPNLEPLRSQPRFVALMTTLQRQSARFQKLAEIGARA